MKNILKSLIFIIIFLTIFNNVFKYMWLDTTSIQEFYKEKKNSIDVMYLGGSTAFHSFNSTLAFDEYGFTTYLMGSNAQPFESTKYLIKESLKYQKPKLYIIDISDLADDIKTVNINIRKVVDSMKFSINRFNTLNALIPNAEDKITKDNYFDYLFSFQIYHNRWKNIFTRDFNYYKIYYKGYAWNKWYDRTEKLKYTEWINDIKDLSANDLKALKDLLNYLKKEKLETLFVIPARVYTDKEMSLINKSIQIIEKGKYKVINFNILDDFKINYDTDFYNKMHLNTLGSTKFTLYFGKYLKNNYNLPNHKNDKNYNSWNLEYERFISDYISNTGKSFITLVNNSNT